MHERPKYQKWVVNAITVCIVSLSLWGFFFISPMPSHEIHASSSSPPKETRQHAQLQNSAYHEATPRSTVNPSIKKSLLVAKSIDWLSFIDGITATLIVTAGSFGIAIYNNRRRDRIKREKKAAKLEKKREAKLLKEQKGIAKFKEQVGKEQEIEQRYREALLKDPHISRLHILEMSDPLDLTSMFVRTRLHKDTRPEYKEPNSFLNITVSIHDLNDLLGVNFHHRNNLIHSNFKAEDAIHANKHNIFVGDSGAGKTTLLKYLALQAANKNLIDNLDLPVYIQLKPFANSKSGQLLDFAATECERKYKIPKADALTLIEQKLVKGTALILLDGLDEGFADIKSEGSAKEKKEAITASYEDTCKAIGQIVTQHPEARIIVTARKAGYYHQKKLSFFTQYEILDFRPEDIEQFVRNWFTCSPDPREGTSDEQLNAQIANNPHLQELATNPLLLTHIVAVYAHRHELSDKRIDLYKECVNILLIEWDRTRGLERRHEFSAENKRELLEEVAWHFHGLHQRYFPQEDLLEIIADFLSARGISSSQNRLILDEITANHGLLKEHAINVYGFLDFAFQEYFTVLYIQNNQCLPALLTHVGDPWWEEIFVLYASQTRDATLLFQELIGTDTQRLLQDDVFNTRLTLAGRCLAARPIIKDKALRQTVISRLFDELISNRYSLNQFHLSDVLAEIGDRGIYEHLIKLLNDNQLNNLTQRFIIESLEKWGKKSIVPILRKALDNNAQDLDIRCFMLMSLGRLGEKTAVSKLKRIRDDERLANELNDAVTKVLRNLGELEDDSVTSNPMPENELINNKQNIDEVIDNLGECYSVTELITILNNPALPANKRSDLNNQLEMLKEKSAIPVLLNTLSDGHHISTEISIIKALGSLGLSDDKPIVPKLMNMLKDNLTAIEVKVVTVQVLIKLVNNNEIVQELAALLPISDVADDIHRALWQICRRMRITIYMKDGQAGPEVKIASLE